MPQTPLPAHVLSLRAFLARLQAGEAVIGTPRAPLVVVSADEPCSPPFVIAHPVVVRDVRFEVPVSFDDTRFAGSVRFERCVFGEGLSMADARIDGTFSLASSRLASPTRGFVDLRRLEVARVTDLAGVTATVPIDLGNARLGDDVRLDGLRVRRAVGAPIEATDARHLADELDGKCLRLEGARIARDVYLTGQPGRRVRLQGTLDVRASIGGTLAVAEACIGTNRSSVAVYADRAAIAGSCFIHDCDITGSVSLRARVDGQVQIVASRLDSGLNATALDFENARVGSSVILANDSRITGRIDLRAHVEGQVALSGVTLRVESGATALTLEGCHVGQSVFVRDGCRITGGLRVSGNIRGQLSVEDSRVTATGGTAALDLSHATLGGAVIVNADVELDGDLSGYALSAGGCIVAARCSAGVVLQNAAIRQHVMFKGLRCAALWLNHAVIGGELMLGDAQIGGDAPLGGDAPHAEHPVAFLAQHVQVGGDVHANGMRIVRPTDSFTWFGDFANAKLGGSLELLRCDIGGYCNLEGAEIAGDLVMAGTTIGGPLHLRSARVAGSVFDDRFTSPPRVAGAIDLRLANMRKLTLTLDAPAIGPASTGERKAARDVLLSDCEVGSLSVRGRLDAARDAVHVDGLAFGALDVSQLESTRRGTRRVSWRDIARAVLWALLVLLAWLLLPEAGWRWALAVFALLTLALAVQHLRATSGHADRRLLDFLAGTQFSRSFYLAVERDLRQQGEDAAADEVFLSRRKREARQAYALSSGPDGLARRLWSELLDLSIGYGVRVSRAVHAYVLLWFLGTGVFSAPASVERPLGFGARLATEAPAERPNPWSDEGGMPDSWSTAEGFFVASRLQLPFLSLPAQSDWAPSSRPVSVLGLSYENLASVFMLVNAVLLPLIIAGLSGILKKNE